MSTKKINNNSEASGSGRLFQDEWTIKYGVIKHNDKALCCICKEIIIARTYNIFRHFVSNHMNELKREFIELCINFGNIVSATTNGAVNMIEKNIGIANLLKQEVNHIYLLNFIEL